MQAVSVTSLASEMIDLVEERKADVVCVSSTPPGAMMHARYLCKQLRRQCPKVKLVVGLWDAQGDLNKAKERIGCGVTVVATMADAQEQVRLLIQEFPPQTETDTPPQDGQMIRRRAHPSSYPLHVDVRSNLERALPGNTSIPAV